MSFESLKFLSYHEIKRFHLNQERLIMEDELSPFKLRGVRDLVRHSSDMHYFLGGNKTF